MYSFIIKNMQVNRVRFLACYPRDASTSFSCSSYKNTWSTCRMAIPIEGRPCLSKTAAEFATVSARPHARTARPARPRHNLDLIRLKLGFLRYRSARSPRLSVVPYCYHHAEFTLVIPGLPRKKKNSSRLPSVAGCYIPFRSAKFYARQLVRACTRRLYDVVNVSGRLLSDDWNSRDIRIDTIRRASEYSFTRNVNRAGGRDSRFVSFLFLLDKRYTYMYKVPFNSRIFPEILSFFRGKKNERLSTCIIVISVCSLKRAIRANLFSSCICVSTCQWSWNPDLTAEAHIVVKNWISMNLPKEDKLILSHIYKRVPWVNNIIMKCWKVLYKVWSCFFFQVIPKKLNCQSATKSFNVWAISGTDY